MRIAFFSRGRGHGHAIPDLEIGAALQRAEEQLKVRFVSYATGAETFRHAGQPVIDLGLPEENPFLETLFAAADVVASERPDIVIAHEEFAALAAARLHRIPSIYLGAWLPPGGPGAEALAYCNSVILLEDPGLFSLPPGATARLQCVGPLIRRLAHTRADRGIIRPQLKLPPEAKCVLVVTGGWASEARAPAIDLLFATYDRLPFPNKRLWWASRTDYDAVTAKAAGRQDVTAFAFVEAIDRLMAAADVVITKGTRGATLDAAAVGTPSISLSPETNPVDDLLVPRIRSNLPLVLRAATPDSLAEYIKQVIARPPTAEPLPAQGVEFAANALRAEIRRLTTV